MFELTQYLYQKKDVSLMIILSLLQRTTIEELYFWISEYYYSGYSNELWELATTIFMDFYVLQYPKYYNTILTQKRKFQKKADITHILHVYKNMFYMKSSHVIFMFRMLLQHSHHVKPHRGRRPQWLQDYKDEHKQIIYSIHKKQLQNALYYFTRVTNYTELYNEILHYTKTNTSKEQNKICMLYDTQTSHYNKDYDKIRSIALLSILFDIHTSESICKKRFIIKPTEKDKETFNSFHKSNKPYCWKFLQEACVYGINPLIHALHHTNKKYHNYWKEIWYHWEYHAYDTPIWKKRFTEYSATKSGKKVIFPSDDLQEVFYDTYGLEPDEQTKETQGKIMVEYTPHTLQEFISNIWNISIGDECDGIITDSIPYNFHSEL